MERCQLAGRGELLGGLAKVELGRLCLNCPGRHVGEAWFLLNYDALSLENLGAIVFGPLDASKSFQTLCFAIKELYMLLRIAMYNHFQECLSGIVAYNLLCTHSISQYPEANLSRVWIQGRLGEDQRSRGGRRKHETGAESY
jgi:hypothetical protein